jgi:hypothetical protein
MDYDGFIKVRLAHAHGFSILVPDLLYADIEGWSWYQPWFFTACRLSYLDEGAQGRLWLNLRDGREFGILLAKDGLVRHTADGASIYRCRISGPENLQRARSGSCRLDAQGNLELKLYHHTKPETIRLIRTSGHFRGSPWNIQGTNSKSLSNVEYAYFTTVQRIRSNDDLEKIAMTSEGFIGLLPTNGFEADALKLPVYRESTFNRRATIPIWVRADALAPQHVYVKRPHGAAAVYYEFCHPQIHRVGLKPGTVLPIAGDRVAPERASLERFAYLVLGDGDTAEGLTAPYDEEDTGSILKLEPLGEPDLFDAWREHANTNVFSGYAVRLQTFQQIR